MEQHAMTAMWGLVDATSAGGEGWGNGATPSEQRIRELEQELALAARRLDDADAAIARRDLIGMAKGIIVATAGCSRDDAFEALTARSSAERRDLYEVATEIVERSHR
jgi:AmiR/NasT family two-component response regulator